MWLINVHTHKLEWHLEPNCPKYAILSHTWDSVEATFQNVHDPNFDMASMMEESRFQKLHLTCRQAREDGYDFAWVDTCCIDKTSTAELSEAINSMFRWYNSAQVCYVYLADLPTDFPPFTDRNLQYSTLRSAPELIAQLASCRWFSRGWTLQEAIAPIEVRFYNREWKQIAVRSQIPRTLAEITGIDVSLLIWATASQTPRSQRPDVAHEQTPLIPSGLTERQSMNVLRRQISRYTIAQRMSWAASRTTTRMEDEAYCLLGLFDISMPMLYGEGTKAFLRLQEEIMKTSTDESILAWDSGDTDIDASSLFAPSPKQFLHARTVVSRHVGRRRAFELTNSGLRITLPVYDDGEETRAILNCGYSSSLSGQFSLRIEYMQDLDCYFVKAPRPLEEFEEVARNAQLKSLSLVRSQETQGSSQPQQNYPDWRVVCHSLFRPYAGFYPSMVVEESIPSTHKIRRRLRGSEYVIHLPCSSGRRTSCALRLAFHTRHHKHPSTQIHRCDVHFGIFEHLSHHEADVWLRASSKRDPLVPRPGRDMYSRYSLATPRNVFRVTSNLLLQASASRLANGSWELEIRNIAPTSELYEAHGNERVKAAEWRWAELRSTMKMIINRIAFAAGVTLFVIVLCLVFYIMHRIRGLQSAR